MAVLSLPRISNRVSVFDFSQVFALFYRVKRLYPLRILISFFITALLPKIPSREGEDDGAPTFGRGN